jgi:hypothetical protein
MSAPVPWHPALPAGWGSRTQTLSVQGSTNGSTFTNLVGSAGYSFDPASSNVVPINFTAASARYVRVNITANTGWAAAQLSELEVHGVSTVPTSPNLAAGKTFSASSAGLPASRAGDGDQASYWESTNNVFPQWVQVDLGSAVSVNKAVLKLHRLGDQDADPCASLRPGDLRNDGGSVAAAGADGSET